MDQKINVVFDINVYVRGFANSSKDDFNCFEAVKINPNLCLVTSKHIVKNAFSISRDQVGYSRQDAENLLTFLRSMSLSSKLIYKDTDPFVSKNNTIGDLELEDSYIFRLTLDSESSILVTNDSDFERVRNFTRDIAIVSPARFIKLTSPKKPPTKPSLGLQFGMNPLDFQPGQGGLGRQI